MRQSPVPHVMLPEQLKTRFLRACSRQGRSMTDVVRQLITEFVEREEQKRP
jgi:plasmid stability protein